MHTQNTIMECSCENDVISCKYENYYLYPTNMTLCSSACEYDSVPVLP